MYKKVAIALVVIIVGLFLYAAYGRKDLTLSKAYVKEKYTLPNSHFIKWNGTEIHYTESGSGIPILMIHGFGGSGRDFILLDSLMQDKYRIIRIDLPGFGLSDFPKQTEENPDYIKVYDDYFTFLLDTLHLDSCYVMGNSLGGLMSWNLAVKHPSAVKKLVLFNSAGYDMKAVVENATNARFFKFPLVRLLLQKGLPVFLTKRGMYRIFYDKSIVTDDRAQRFNDFWNRQGNLKQVINMVTSEKYVDESLVKQIACPTLIVWGKYDKIVDPKYAERFHSDIMKSRVIMYDSCGHVPMLERPLDVKRDVLQFLSE